MNIVPKAMGHLPLIFKNLRVYLQYQIVISKTIKNV